MRYLFLLFSFLALSLHAQECNNTADTTVAHYVRVTKYVYQGDTIPNVEILSPLYKYPPQIFSSEQQRKRYSRLVYNVKKVLPYAKMSKFLIVETFKTMQTLPTEEEKRAHLKSMEIELRKTYTPVLKTMTRSQGRLLIKLIDRECNQTGLSIARAFLGTARANVYQGIAFIFGQSLARRYDPEGKDREVEKIVRLIESGQL